MPFSRRTRTAASMSPFVSCRARLQSIIGAPVWSRSSFTSAAEISAIGLRLLRYRRLRDRRLRDTRLRDRRLRDRLLAGRDLLVVALGHRRLLRRGAVAGGCGREVRRRRLLLSGRDAVGENTHDQVARADRVVVPGDDVVGLVGIAVRVDDRDDRQAETTRLANGELLLAEVDDEDGVGLALHVGDAAEVLLELLELLEHRDALLRGQQLELLLLLQASQLVQPVDAVGDRAPVREQAAEPAMADVRHVDALRLLLDRALALLLRADEEHRAAA